MSIIVGLVILGLVFIFFEVIVAGVLLGILGGASIVAAAVIAFQNYGVMWGIMVFMGSVVLMIILLVFEFRWLPKTRVGKRMFLEKSVEAQSTEFLGTDELIGKKGETQTILAPSGRVIVEGKEYEGFSQDGLIKQGEVVRVVGRDNFRIIVKKLNELI